MAAGGSSMNNQQTRNLLELLNGVNFSSFDENNQGYVEDDSEEVRRNYLLGRMITDILAADINPQVKKHQLEELKGKNSSQLWQMVKWEKKVEYGATEEEYEAIPEEHRGELQPVSISEMKLVGNYFTDEVKQAMDGIPRPSDSYNYSAAPPVAAAQFIPPQETGNIRENIKGLHKQVSSVLASEGNSLEKRRSIAELRRGIQGHLAKNIPANARQELEEIHTMVDKYLTDYMKRRTFTIRAKRGYKNVTPAAKSQVSGRGNRWPMTKGSPRKTRKTRRSKHRK